MRQLVLHIGPHNTGTKAIQQTLWENAKGLARAGILYPHAAQGDGRPRPGRAHHPIARQVHGSLPGGVESEGYGLADLERTLATTEAETVVLSSEAFSAPDLPPERLDRFLGSVRERGFEVTAIAFLRDQPDLMNSRYVQLVKTLSTAVSFEDYLQAALATPEFRPNERFAVWLAHPQARFVAAPYTAATTGPKIAEAMLAAAGVSPERLSRAGLRPAEYVNENLGCVAVAAFRHLLGRAPDLSQDQARRTETARLARAEAELRGWSAPRFVGLDEDRARRIREAVAADNDAFARRVWGSPWSSVLDGEPPRVWQANEWDPARLPPELRAKFDAFAEMLLAGGRGRAIRAAAGQGPDRSPAA